MSSTPESSATATTELFDDEGAQVLLKQVFDVWVGPEIERRKVIGSLPEGFVVTAAQVIMNVDEPTLVRLNEEVRVIAMAVAARPVEKGQSVYAEDIKSIERLVLTNSDPNAGHITAILFEGRWLISFDFRYNAQRAEHLLTTAEEYWDCAVHAKSVGHCGPFIENLFTAAELTAKAHLLLVPDKAVLESKTHGIVGSKIDSHAKMGMADTAFVAQFNKLVEKRKSARYSTGRLAIDGDEMASMSDLVKATLDSTRERLPERYPVT